MRDDPDENTKVDAGHRIRAATQVLCEQFLARGMQDHVLEYAVERFPYHGVAVVPPHVVLRRRLPDDELVSGRPPSMRSGG